MITRTRVSLVVTLILVAVACSSDADESATASRATVDADGPEWPLFGHDLSNTRLNVHEDEISAETVAALSETWSIDGLVGVSGTPIVVDGDAYFGDWTGAVRAVDAETGVEIWTTPLDGTVTGSLAMEGDGLYAASGRTLYRLDRATGTVVWASETHDHPFAMVSSSPVIADGRVYQGVASGEVTVPRDDYTFRGSIAAYDAATGGEVWRLYTTPDDATGGAGVGIWSTPAIDPERGMLYVGTGNTYEEPSSPLADSILAVDITTGEVRWSTQFTEPDVFSAGNPTGKDADVGAAPNLWTFGGRDLVGAGDKTGVYHALDRESGDVVWETTLTPGSVFGGDIGSSAFVDGMLVVPSNIGNPESNTPTGAAKVFALDAGSGAIAWQSGELDGSIYAPVSAVPGVAFVGTTVGALLALDAATGDELWRHQAPDQTGGGPSVVGGRVLWGYGFALFEGPGDGGVISFALDDETPDSAAADPAIAERGPVASPGCELATASATGVSDRTTISGGVERRFQLTVPDGYDGVTPLPVVFGLHGLTVSYQVVPAISGFADMAQQYRFVGVSPSGLLDGETPYWLAAPTDSNRDVAFISDLLDLLESELCIDTTRVYSTGISNGAQMSSLLACELSDRITAVAPVAGVEFSETCAGDPVPVIAFHGTADPIVTYDGGGLNATTIADLHYWKGMTPSDRAQHRGVDEAMRRWADHNGCDPQPIEDQTAPQARRRTWTGCAAETVLYVIEGGGHGLPGAPVPGFETAFGPTTTEIDAAQLMFDFFLGPPPG